jgi:hypothetical protein
MHAQPPRTLKRLLKQYGQELIDDPRRTEALLRDHCGQHTREIFVLVNAQKQRVPSELLAAPAWMPRQATYSRLSRQLQTKLALTEDAADWAVAAWAAALELESLPKGDPWSWLPGQTRAPAPSGRRKSRSKKRQNSASSVQSQKSTSRNSSKQARARAARAEMGWSFPKLDFSPLLRLVRTPVAWANLLPWMALLAATVFLLAVVYWTSTTRSGIERLNQLTGNGTPMAESNESAADSGDNTDGSHASEGSAPTPVNTNVTPLPELPAPPSEYLYAVMPLPTDAYVNVIDEPLLVREQPSMVSAFLTVLQDGTAVYVTAFSDDGRWSQITLPHEGWVSNDFLLFSDDTADNLKKLSVQQLRTRNETKVLAAPLAGAAATTTLDAGELVVVAAVIGEPATWYQIADPALGWVAAADLAPAFP